MADLHIKAGSSGASPFDTWAKAATTAAGATGGVAGDRYLLSSAHSETSGSAINLTYASSLAAPVHVLSSTEDTASGITALTKGAALSVTGAVSVIFDFIGYVYGIVASGGGSAGAGGVICGSTGNKHQVFDTCDFQLGTNASSRITAGTNASGAGTNVVWRNCGVKFGNASQRIDVRGTFEWRGGSILSGGTAPSGLINWGSSWRCGQSRIVGVDLSNGSSSMNLISAHSGTGKCSFINCKLPASWTGNLVGTVSYPGFRAEMINCDSTDTNYQMWIEDYSGSIKSETTLVRTGGASDGTTTLSWKMTSSADADMVLPLVSNDISIWNDTSGSSKTLTVEILHDSATALKDNEIWLEVDYLGTSGYPLSSLASDGVSIITAGSNQASSSATWTTTGMSNPNKQKLSVTVTPQEAGPITARVVMAKPSYTVYVDPLLVVS